MRSWIAHGNLYMNKQAILLSDMAHLYFVYVLFAALPSVEIEKHHEKQPEKQHPERPGGEPVWYICAYRCSEFLKVYSVQPCTYVIVFITVNT